MYQMSPLHCEKCIVLFRVGRRDGKSFLACRDIAAELMSRPISAGSYMIGMVSKDRRIANENARNILQALAVMDWDPTANYGNNHCTHS